MRMSLFESILLGAIEGFTEFLPISSTGHLILATELLGIPLTEAVKTFQIAVQLGAILAVMVLFWRKFLDFKVLTRLAVAFVPTGILGLLLYRFIKDYLIGNSWVVVAALFLGGVALILFERFHSEPDEAQADLAALPYKTAVTIGLFQSIAMIPGVSRSAATIVGGLLLGMKRTAIVEFSFLLAVPTMLAATGYDLLKTADTLQGADITVLIAGFVTSFVVALLSMRLLLSFVKNHSFVPFGVYRIIIAVLFVLVVLW